MVRRKRNGKRGLRATVIFDGDNLCHTFGDYGVSPNLDDIPCWLLRDEAPFGVDRVRRWCYFKSYDNPRMPQEGDRPFRQPKSDNRLFCDHRYQAGSQKRCRVEQDIIGHALATIGQWDTLFLVTSDVRSFKDFADYIRSVEFPGKEAVIIASHLSAYSGWLDTIANGYSLEAIYPNQLLRRFVDRHGFNPEKSFPVLQPA